LNQVVTADLLDPRSTTFRDTTRREPSDIGVYRAVSDRIGRRLVLLALGASNIANEGAAGARYVPRCDVHNFNFLEGKSYRARDPLLGATRDRSNFLTRFADRLIESGVCTSVLLVPVGYGATFVADWTPGGCMHPRIDRTLKELRKHEVAVTHVLYQQGEAEADLGPGVNDAKAWQEAFMRLVGSLRQGGVTAPVYVAQCTICRGERNDLIREAQRRVVDPAAGILAGADTDTIGLGDRWDGCHFSETGLNKAADLWLEAFSRT
jgi:Carbohydrate esterase, sialic acid-specific acetylesterase